MRTYGIDGRGVGDLASLCEAFARAVGAPAGSWGTSLQSFDDRLFGGYGLVAPCEIVWEHSAASRARLDSRALAGYCQQLLDARDYVDEEGLGWITETKAKAERGTRTLFDEVVECIGSVFARSLSKVKVDLVLR